MFAAERLTSHWKEIVFGILISVAGLATILPEVVKNISSLLNIENYTAFRLFSFFYFLLPLVIITSLVWSWRLDRGFSASIISFALKILPFIVIAFELDVDFIFWIDEPIPIRRLGFLRIDWFNLLPYASLIISAFWALWYLIIFIGETILFTKKSIRSKGKLVRFAPFLVQKVGGLLFILNLVVGLGVVILTNPYLINNKILFFYPLIIYFSLGFIFLGIRLLWGQKDREKNSRIVVYFASVLFILTLSPALNLHLTEKEHIGALLALTFILAFVLTLIYYRKEKSTNRFRAFIESYLLSLKQVSIAKWPSLIAFFVGCVLLIFIYHNQIHHYNLSHLNSYCDLQRVIGDRIEKKEVSFFANLKIYCESCDTFANRLSDINTPYEYLEVIRTSNKALNTVNLGYIHREIDILKRRIKPTIEKISNLLITDDLKATDLYTSCCDHRILNQANNVIEISTINRYCRFYKNYSVEEDQSLSLKEYLQKYKNISPINIDQLWREIYLLKERSDLGNKLIRKTCNKLTVEDLWVLITYGKMFSGKDHESISKYISLWNRHINDKEKAKQPFAQYIGDLNKSIKNYRDKGGVLEMFSLLNEIDIYHKQASNSKSHPMDITTKYIQHYQDSLDQSDKMIQLAGEIFGLAVLKLENEDINGLNDKIGIQWSKLWNNYNRYGKREYGRFAYNDNIDDRYAEKMMKWHTVFSIYRKNQLYERAIEGRKVFKIYLIVVQRRGILIFGLTLLILLFAIVEVYKSDMHKKRQDVDTSALREGGLFLRVCFLSIFILFYALLEPIKESSIDLSNPYWALRIGNWNFPSYFKETIYPVPEIPELKGPDIDQQGSGGMDTDAIARAIEKLKDKELSDNVRSINTGIQLNSAFIDTTRTELRAQRKRTRNFINGMTQ
ncbi:MAG: hypothetical protein AAF944_03595 [Bacteroidota bacterium]